MQTVALEGPLSQQAAILFDADRSLTSRCTGHLIQSALRCRFGRPASSACELKR